MASQRRLDLAARSSVTLCNLAVSSSPPTMTQRHSSSTASTCSVRRVQAATCVQGQDSVSSTVVGFKPRLSASADETDLLAAFAELFLESADEISSCHAELCDKPSSLDPLTASEPVAVRNSLTALQFAAKFRHIEPVIIPQLASSWRAMHAWSDPNYLKQQLVEKVTVLKSGDNRTFLKRDCVVTEQPFSSVVHALFQQSGHIDDDGSDQKENQPGSERLYARAPLSGGLLSDVDLASLAALTHTDRAFSFKTKNCGVWLSSPGCETPLHYDLCHGLLVQVIGVKIFTYIHPDDSNCLYQRPEHPELSQVDLSLWRQKAGSDEASFERACRPRFRDVDRTWTVELHPGDVLYTPPFWWHHVQTVEKHGPSISVLVPFDMDKTCERVHRCHYL